MVFAFAVVLALLSAGSVLLVGEIAHAAMLWHIGRRRWLVKSYSANTRLGDFLLDMMVLLPNAIVAYTIWGTYILPPLTEIAVGYSSPFTPVVATALILIVSIAGIPMKHKVRKVLLEMDKELQQG